ncbi:MAG: hypothetical protein HY070_11595, partial [Chloroflexi bacterium]|nr:hypothetical protein [Chloroflexota bacterium]
MRKIFCVFGALAFSACAAPASAPPPAPTLPATIAPTATLIPTSTTEPTAVPVFTPTTIATISAIQQPTSTRAAIIAIDSSWSVFRPEVVDLEIKGKTLTLVLNRTALWFNNQHGALVYKLVTGNFKATAIVNARKRTNPAQAP